MHYRVREMDLRGVALCPHLTSVRRSNICLLSAIGLGWEKAFGPMDVSGNIVENAKGWVEIDNKNQVSPEWEAFRLF
jgi:hypothetical protein